MVFIEERRRSTTGPMNNSSNMYGDANQLFLGNLPHSATEDELRDLFSQFGNVIELRIHSKPGSKGVGPGNRVPPNYGFITYEDQQSVQNCLANRVCHIFLFCLEKVQDVLELLVLKYNFCTIGHNF